MDKSVVYHLKDENGEIIGPSVGLPRVPVIGDEIRLIKQGEDEPRNFRVVRVVFEARFNGCGVQAVELELWEWGSP